MEDRLKVDFTLVKIMRPITEDLAQDGKDNCTIKEVKILIGLYS